MELKELILSTLQELNTRTVQEEKSVQAVQELQHQEDEVSSKIFEEAREVKEALIVPKVEEELPASLEQSPQNDDEIAYLEHTKERLLVLFEGLQAKETKEIEKKVDLVLRFLEFQLATIEDRLEAKQ